jgi:hypothetical protein
MNVPNMHFEQIPVSEVKKIVQESEQERYMDDGKMKYPEWQQPLLEAILEFDPEVLARKIRHAEVLIKSRRRELWADGKDANEERALEDALASLRILKRDRLAQPRS